MGCSRHFIEIHSSLPLSHYMDMEIEADHRQRLPTAIEWRSWISGPLPGRWLQDLEAVEA